LPLKINLIKSFKSGETLKRYVGIKKMNEPIMPLNTILRQAFKNI
jgi:hypothetical protein